MHPDFLHDLETFDLPYIGLQISFEPAGQETYGEDGLPSCSMYRSTTFR